jgi:predicted dehydrogenase
MGIRFGVVGTGFWAEDVHLPILRGRAGVELVGVWGRDAVKAEALAGRFGARGFARYVDMLAAVDAVSFAVPPDIQPDLAIAAARAGRQLLLEKPLALSPEVARKVGDEVEAAGVAAVMFFTRRFVPEIVAALPGIVAQRPWAAGRAFFHSGAMLPGTPYAGSAWRQHKGALWDLGPHALSVLLPVLGAVAQARASQTAPGVTELALRHVGGARSTASLSFHAAPADCGEFYEFSAEGRHQRIDVAPGPRQPCFAATLEVLLKAIARPGAEPPACGVRLGCEVVDILSEAEESFARPG